MVTLAPTRAGQKEKCRGPRLLGACLGFGGRLLHTGRLGHGWFVRKAMWTPGRVLVLLLPSLVQGGLLAWLI